MLSGSTDAHPKPDNHNATNRNRVPGANRISSTLARNHARRFARRINARPKNNMGFPCHNGVGANFGKAVPGLIVGLAQSAVISLIVTQVFGIRLSGSAFVLFFGLTVFLLAVIGVALFVSSLTSNQQQAMMGIMVVMMPAMMLSGFSSPVQNMPVVAAAARDDQSADAYSGDHSRGVPARHAVLAGCRAHLADGRQRGRDHLGGGVDVQAERSISTQVDANRENRMSRLFSQTASYIARYAGRPGTFLLSILIIVAWALTGPLFSYSDTWQLIINTGTTIITFLMVFIIQNTQNRDGAAIQAKLDELIRSSHAQNKFIGIENLTDDEIEEYRQSCAALAQKAAGRAALRAQQKK